MVQGEKATARTEEEKKIAEEERKAKEAEAKMDLHQAKAEHAAHTHFHHNQLQEPPLGGQRRGHKFP